MTETRDTGNLAFARLLKFWRTSFGYSQEALSASVGVSTRHLSFLETGRSNPSRVLVVDLATEFKLSMRDTNNLLVAANFNPVDSKLIVGAEKENYYTDKAMALSLRAVTGTPACIADAFGNIMLVNRDWVYFHSFWSTRFIDGSCTNTYQLYLSEQDLGNHLTHWEQVASALLLTLQQEILLSDDDSAKQLFETILRYPRIPKNWQKLGAAVPYNHSFKMDLNYPKGGLDSYIAVNNTLGATPYVSKPRRIISSLHRISQHDDIDMDRYNALSHPLMVDA